MLFTQIPPDLLPAFRSAKFSSTKRGRITVGSGLEEDTAVKELMNLEGSKCLLRYCSEAAPTGRIGT